MRAVMLVVIIVTAMISPAWSAELALVGGTVHPVSGPPVENGTVLVVDGKIAAVGSDLDIPAGAERVDVRGLHVYPGLIAANTVLGLVEIGSVRGTLDYNETGEINPNARATVAINADSELIPVTRANGVLTVLSATTGGLLAGTSCVWNLDGWNWEEMTLVDDVALHVRWPGVRSKKDESKKKIKKIEDAFDNARAYKKAREAGDPHHDADVRWEAMLPVLEGRMPVFVHADEIRQIESALDFAAEQEVRMVLVGGRDSWRVADRLAAENVAVVLENADNLPRRSWEPYDACFTVAKQLHGAGVRFCFSTGGTGGSAANTRNLPYGAATAAAFGLPRDEALKGVTLYPAQILGLDDRLGSIEPGKDANLIVTDGDPLEVMTRVRRAWIAGREIGLESRHTRLYEKYDNRPRTGGGASKLEPAY